MIEQTFNNRYHLEDRIGEGGTAIVYGGMDALLRRRVAVKVLRPQFATDAEFVRRFYHEAESAARLSHPNIVNIYDVGREHDTYYIVMELIDGTTLAKVIADDGALSERSSLDYAVQVCNGLAYAHRQGLLHRDIKPANILLTTDGIVKLSDFGIARAVERQTLAMTQHGMVMGSVFYLSPEQAQDHGLSPASDLYGVGVVLYEMLTGLPPFTGDSPIAIALKHVSDPPPTLPTAIAPPLAAIITKLLQKDPTMRYQSADELAKALRAARESTSTTPVRGLDQTTVSIPTVSVPNPPPRRSPLPDRPTGDAPRGPRLRVRDLIGIFGIVAVVCAAVVYIFLTHASRAASVATLSLPNETNATMGDAQAALTAAGFNVRIATEESETVPAGSVVRQDPPALTAVGHGATVTLTISSGLPRVDVPDVASFSVDDAKRLLDQNKLDARVTTKYDSAARGTVLSQQPGPHSKLREHGIVALVVSEGMQPAAVPNVTALTLDAARALADKAKVKIVVAQETSSDDIPAGTIISQDPKEGAAVDNGTTVSVTVSLGPTATVVPDVTSARLEDALSQLQAAGFQPQVGYNVAAGANNGTVIGENPGGGSRARRGSTITVVVAVSGLIPDVSGMSLDAARTALQDAGYVVGNVAETSDGADNKIVRTEPAAGTVLRPGESVEIYQNQTSPDGVPTAR